MEEAPCISQIASLLAEPKRTAMLWSLMDGSAKTADELAMLAGLSAASANAHLARLIGSGLLRSEAKRGKRLFRMAAVDVCAAVDALACTTLACAARNAPQVSPQYPWRRRRCGARVCARGIWAVNWQRGFISACWRPAGSTATNSVPT